MAVTVEHMSGFEIHPTGPGTDAAMLVHHRISAGHRDEHLDLEAAEQRLVSPACRSDAPVHRVKVAYMTGRACQEWESTNGY